MKRLAIVTFAAGLYLTTVATVSAQTTVNINGRNDWTDAGAAYGGPGNVPTLVTNAMNHTLAPPPPGYQSGCLEMGPVAGDPLRVPMVSLPQVTDITDPTTLTMWQYIPSTITTAYGFWDGGFVWETAYVNSPGSGFGQQNRIGSHYNIIFDQWEEFSYTWDPNNGFTEYYGTPGNMILASSVSLTEAQSLAAASGVTWPHPINGLDWFVQQSFNGTPITGPIYWDDMQFKVGNSVAWSDNFDNYVPAPEPSTLALFGVGAIGFVGYGWRKRRFSPRRRLEG